MRENAMDRIMVGILAWGAGFAAANVFWFIHIGLKPAAILSAALFALNSAFYLMESR